MDEKQTALLFVRAARGGRHPGIGSDDLVGIKNTFVYFLKCRDGGTGRRNRLKIYRSQGHEGSSPSPGTNKSLNKILQRDNFVV